MRKKVCILTSAHSALDDRIFYKEAKTLAKTGYDVSIIGSHHKEETLEKIKIIPFPKNRFLGRIFFTNWKMFFVAKNQKADIYHFHDPDLLLVGLFLKIFTKRKVIYDVHEDFPEQLFPSKIPFFIRNFLIFFINFLEKLISKKFDYVIAATEDIKNKFQQYHCRVIDVKNYPVIGFFLQDDLNIPIKKEKDCPTLIYIGSLSKERGIREIIEAVKLVNLKHKVRLKIIGWFSNKNFEKEIKKISPKEVEFVNGIPYTQIPQELKAADIGLVCLRPDEPRYRVSLPVKLFEYMITGLPVIASNFLLWKEIVEKNNCGICVDPLKPEEIAKTIEYLINHPIEAKQMGENGKKAILEKYNWENESKKLLKVYENLLK